MHNSVKILRRKLFLAGCLLATHLSANVGTPAATANAAPAPVAPIIETTVVEKAMAVANGSTADHSKFDELKQDFKSGPEVTEACLSCHTEAAKQVQHTKHWTWEFLNPATKQKLGKKNVINNFCTSVESNQTFCSACHVVSIMGWVCSSPQ